MSVLEEVQEAVTATAAGVGGAVVAVRGARGRGSGFVVAPDRVLTNAHNVAGDDVSVVFEDGREHRGEVVGVDVDGDLAVIGVATDGATPAEWASDNGGVGLGTAVFALARDGRGRLRVTSGFVSTTERAFRGPRGRRIAGAFEHTAPLARGSSGGPVVDVDGRVVGIDTNRVGDGFYLAVPAGSDLRSRVEALGRGESPQRRRLGIVLAPAGWARHARAAVGLAPRDGLLVGGVVDDSPASRAGLRRGDLIVRAAAAEVTSLDDLQAVLDAHEGDAPLTLVVIRGDEERSVTVSFTTTGEHGSA